MNPKDQSHLTTIILSAVFIFLICVRVESQSNAPHGPPAPPMPTQQQQVQSAPQPQQAQNQIPPALAAMIKKSLDDLQAADPAWMSKAKTFMANWPWTVILTSFLGLLKICILPLHTYLDQKNQKLSPEKYAAIKTSGTTMFKQLDWLCFFLFSIRPSTVMAASAAKKAATTLPPPSLEYSLSVAKAHGWGPMPAPVISSPKPDASSQSPGTTVS